jgi:hypothetical protein
VNSSPHHTSLGVAALLMLLSMIADAQQTGSFQRTLTIDGPVQLDVRTGAGAITIEAGPAADVHVVGHVQVRRQLGRSASDADALIQRLQDQPPIEVSGNRVRVGHVSDRAYRRNVTISYHITVPEESSVASQTGSGKQEVSGISGPVSVRAGSGNLTLTNLAGPVEATTGSGSVQAERIGGAFKARAGSGSVSLVQTGPGDVEVTTGSGSIDLRGVDGGLQARAGSGRIKAQGVQRTDWELRTGSGSVRVSLPGGAGFELDAAAGSGRVHTDHPVTLEGTLRRNQLNGQVREGGPTLRVRTGSGNIRIE